MSKHNEEAAHGAAKTSELNRYAINATKEQITQFAADLLPGYDMAQFVVTKFSFGGHNPQKGTETIHINIEIERKTVSNE